MKQGKFFGAQALRHCASLSQSKLRAKLTALLSATAETVGCGRNECRRSRKVG